MSTALNAYLDFPYVGQCFCIERSFINQKTGKHHQEWVYGVTSASPEQATPERLLQQNRSHWGIENRLHWVRDVTFGEDRSAIRTGNGPRVMAALRNFAISLLRLLGFKKIASATRELGASVAKTLNKLGL